jgi:plasmid maintenance system killer protein
MRRFEKGNMSIQQVRKNDFRAIEETVAKYLEKKLTLLQMTYNIEVLADVTFSSSDTKNFYSFLINSMGDLEVEFFIKAGEVVNNEHSNYTDELINLAKKFQKELQVYKKSLFGGESE